MLPEIIKLDIWKRKNYYDSVFSNFTSIHWNQIPIWWGASSNSWNQLMLIQKFITYTQSNWFIHKKKKKLGSTELSKPLFVPNINLKLAKNQYSIAYLFLVLA